MIRKILAIVLTLGVAGFAVSCSSSTEESSAPPAKAAAVPAVTPATLEKGRAIYKTKCVACHGETGRGDGPAAGVMKPAPRDHTDRAYMATLSDDELGKVIQMGGAIKGKPLMPSSPDLRGADLAAVVAYTRSLSAGATTP